MRLSILAWGLTAGMFSSNTLGAEQLYLSQPADIAPRLAQHGAYPVGVTTLTIIHAAQLEPLTQQIEDRNLVLEVWYPATLTTPDNGSASPQGLPASAQLATYENVTKRGHAFQIQGSARRDASADQSQRYPLIVLSHGYTGYRTLMYYLGEHLASHGYVVAAIDHPHSTNAEIDHKNAPFRGFLNTLFHRSRDQQFVLSHFRAHPTSLQSIIDTQAAAVIGYSMGGYGAINTVGGCFNFTAQSIAALTGNQDEASSMALQQALNSCAGGQYQDVKVDPAWKAAIAIAPWGGQHQLFAAEALQQIQVPLMYWAGDHDDVSGYKGMQWLYEKTGSPAKYLLTYHHARHNIAPHPAPAIARNNKVDFTHYHEPSWSTQTINHINQHFALAMLDCHVKAKAEQCAFLALSPTPAEGNATDSTQSGWLGFPARYDTGLSWQYLQKTN